MARWCHLQSNVTHLFSSVSSSGGGLPGRLDLNEIEALVIFGQDYHSEAIVKHLTAVQPLSR
jgi:hypothetical protein